MRTEDVIREMREIAAVLTYEHSEPYVVTSGEIKDWADALEAAMREPVATIIEAEDGFRYCDWDSALETGTKLFAFPPDAAGEIEMLRTENRDLAHDNASMVRALLAKDKKIARLRAEIERLREAAKTTVAYLRDLYPSDRAEYARKLLRAALAQTDSGA
jgi:hypothetical protein